MASFSEFWRVLGEFWRVFKKVIGKFLASFGEFFASFGDFLASCESFGQFLARFGEAWRVLASLAPLSWRTSFRPPHVDSIFAPACRRHFCAGLGEPFWRPLYAPFWRPTLETPF